jgi:hypothetical protein
MIHVYYFDSSGVCLLRFQSENEQIAMLKIERDNPEEYVVSDKSIELQRAKFFEGQLVDVESTKTVQQINAEARAKREMLLIASDWTDTLSAPGRLGEDIYQAWQTYRQALRDITEQPGFPLEVVWPEMPTS